VTANSKRRLERLEERLSVKTKEGVFVVPYECPLKEGGELEKCAVYQEKKKTAEVILLSAIPRPRDEAPIKECLECPYALERAIAGDEK